MKLSFSTKARTLQSLTGVLKSAKILPLVWFSTKAFKADRRTVLDKIYRALPGATSLIVRSSCTAEDHCEISNAGRFKSVANVDKNLPESLTAAIENVIGSYDDDRPENEVLIQPMLENISMSGVVFTADLNTFAPYYCINYDQSGACDGITGGTSDSAQTYIRYKYSPSKIEKTELGRVIEVCEECEQLFQNAYLDIEFAFNTANELFLLQIRPLVVRKHQPVRTDDLNKYLNKVYKKINKLSAPHPDLLGDKAIYGVMPDWNPAEIIGLKPKNLALSLYRELITDRTWAYQRDNYGYRNLRSHPLMISFLGVPFIDVRVCFNSFIPKILHENIAKKLIDYYLQKLIATPHYHDKVEFEIVFSCYYLGLPQQLHHLLDDGFNTEEVKQIEFSLLDLTNHIINPETGLYRKDIEKIDILKRRFDQIKTSDLSLIDKIYWLVEDCKRYGTLPFAGIARAAFIAVQFLHSFVRLEIISVEELDAFMNSLSTITRKLHNDLVKLSQNKISREEFLETYGHLRPGTYDILSPNYRENFEQYFGNTENYTYDNGTVQDFRISREQMKSINTILIENGIKVNALQLIRFIKEAIEGREYSKFIFTKSLNEILTLIEKLGLRLNINKQDLAFLNIQTILNLYASVGSEDISDFFKMNIEYNKKAYQLSHFVKFPSLIVAANDIYDFYLENDQPNFITLKSIVADTAAEEDIITNDLNGKIVFIRSADPGYDFLFTKNIAGLVTQFGGANSHMAVRCAELEIPAVIGSGEKKFNIWNKARRIEINCMTQNVKMLS